MLDQRVPRSIKPDHRIKAIQTAMPIMARFSVSKMKPNRRLLEPPTQALTIMRRELILDSPQAPITHHWLDSMHISFGVVTAGSVLAELRLADRTFEAAPTINSAIS